MHHYEKLIPPKDGSPIELKEGKVITPNNPIIPFIEGDGVGPDIWRACEKVINAAVEKSYQGKRKIVWFEIMAGEKAQKIYGELLPKDTLEAIKDYRIAIKGPLTTPVGGGFRSLNVTLRQVFDLYACIRPCRWYEGIPSPVKHPEKLNVIIFRENTEDLYAGIEWKAKTSEAEKVIKYLKRTMRVNIRDGSGIGIKPISEFGSKRLIRRAIKYAIERKRRSVTLVHKGNIMKYTEGAFRDWGYELAKEEFSDITITEQELMEKYNGVQPEGKIVIKDRIADNMFQQVLTRPDEYDIIATPNLNGDYLSDACAAQVGGLGIAPGANVGDTAAIFEATHGTAPKYAGKDMVNPGSIILSGVMMLEYLGWTEAANLIEEAFTKTIKQKIVTYDLERQMEGATKVSTSGFAEAIIKNMEN